MTNPNVPIEYKNITDVENKLHIMFLIQQTTGDCNLYADRIKVLQETLEAFYDEAQAMRQLDPTIYAS